MKKRENIRKGILFMDYIPAKTIVTRTKDRWWFGTIYGMNMYRGCNFGCIYCDSRSDCYGVENFGHVRAKADALRIMRDDLRSLGRKGVIHTGAMSDPYTPVEKKLKLLGHGLELINAFGFGVAVVTKSTLVTRDIGVLQDISKHAPVMVGITITTADDKLAKIIEPGAPSTTKRFEALKELSAAGIFCCVVMMPLLPFINDTPENVTRLVTQAHQAGAKFVFGRMGLTLRDGQRNFFYNQLQKHFPMLKEKYQATYGSKYQANSPQYRKLYAILKKSCQPLGLLHTMEDITITYQKNGFSNEQLTLF